MLPVDIKKKLQSEILFIKAKYHFATYPKTLILGCNSTVTAFVPGFHSEPIMQIY